MTLPAPHLEWPMCEIGDLADIALIGGERNDQIAASTSLRRGGISTFTDLRPHKRSKAYAAARHEAWTVIDLDTERGRGELSRLQGQISRA